MAKLKDESVPAKLRDMCAGLNVVEEKKPTPTYKERFPVPAGFLEQLKYNIKRADYLSLLARREGLLKLEDEVGFEDGREDIFSYGLQFVVDGVDPKYIDKVLSNLIEHEADIKMKLLKTIQKEAVLSIQVGDNVRLLIMLLISYVDNETLKWLQREFVADGDIRELLR